MDNAEAAERLAKSFFGRAFASGVMRSTAPTPGSRGVGRQAAMFARSTPLHSNQTAATRGMLAHQAQVAMFHGASLKAVTNKLATSQQRLKAAPAAAPGLLPTGSMGSGFSGAAPRALGQAPTQGTVTAAAPIAPVGVTAPAYVNPVIGNQNAVQPAGIGG